MTPLSEIEDTLGFWTGTRFRIYEIGLNVSKKEEDYYEYMLAEIPGERSKMLIVCVEGYKSGNSIGYVNTTNDISKFIVTAKDIKNAVGTDNVYVLASNHV